MFFFSVLGWTFLYESFLVLAHFPPAQEQKTTPRFLYGFLVFLASFLDFD